MQHNNTRRKQRGKEEHFTTEQPNATQSLLTTQHNALQHNTTQRHWNHNTDCPVLKGRQSQPYTRIHKFITPNPKTYVQTYPNPLSLYLTLSLVSPNLSYVLTLSFAALDQKPTTYMNGIPRFWVPQAQCTRVVSSSLISTSLQIILSSRRRYVLHARSWLFFPVFCINCSSISVRSLLRYDRKPTPVRP